MSTERWIIPRKGLYIDPIVIIIWETLLHFIFTLICQYLVQSGGVTVAALAKSRNNWVVDNTWNWKQEVVVVTSGSGGIGGVVAQRLAVMRAQVVVLDIAPLAYECGNSRIIYHACDLSEEKEIAAACEKIRSQVSHPTVLINNAGLSRGRNVVEAPFLLTKEFLPAMIRRIHGNIFNVASMSAFIPPPGIADYTASKAGLITFYEAGIKNNFSQSGVTRANFSGVFLKSFESRMHPKSVLLSHLVALDAEYAITNSITPDSPIFKLPYYNLPAMN
ncbi:short chain dehydrogenase/reductase family protein [Aspergillus affinis]|uniref:short chain dehydrogenase/reductase family protein n=1 Tax=Aspergillus affinis TaxID=1070780 RepID=UPI0022FDFF8B|nr:short chain dehydrogenase/reductase family protein [Aspergillus affinis]KAI9034846.1 short chain dehydrogenase/reductase family protein [Aspergillus affinis]